MISPTFTSAPAHRFHHLPLRDTRPASKASLATVLRLMIRDTFRNLSIRMFISLCCFSFSAQAAAVPSVPTDAEESFCHPLLPPAAFPLPPDRVLPWEHGQQFSGGRNRLYQQTILADISGNLASVTREYIPHHGSDMRYPPDSKADPVKLQISFAGHFPSPLFLFQKRFLRTRKRFKTIKSNYLLILFQSFTCFESGALEADGHYFTCLRVSAFTSCSFSYVECAEAYQLYFAVCCQFFCYNIFESFQCFFSVFCSFPPFQQSLLLIQICSLC